MNNMWAGHRQTFVATASRKPSFASAASVVENEVSKLDRLKETVDRLKFGKADVERANVLLTTCLTQIKEVLQINNSAQHQMSESPEERPSFR